jgi:hypothetical protein
MQEHKTHAHTNSFNIMALPWQWIRQRASILRYSYIACLVILISGDSVNNAGKRIGNKEKV